MIVGGYLLDLYCDNEDAPEQHYKAPYNPQAHQFREFPHQYTGETRAECVRQARAEGWLIGKTRQLCPKCNRRVQKEKRDA